MHYKLTNSQNKQCWQGAMKNFIFATNSDTFLILQLSQIGSSDIVGKNSKANDCNNTMRNLDDFPYSTILFSYIFSIRVTI